MSNFCPHCDRPYEKTPVVFERNGVRLAGFKVTAGGVTVRLTKVLMKIMEPLVRYGRVSRTFLIDELVDDLAQTADNRLVAVHVWRLRKRIKDLPVEIKALYGEGYELVAKPTTDS